MESIAKKLRKIILACTFIISAVSGCDRSPKTLYASDKLKLILLNQRITLSGQTEDFMDVFISPEDSSHYKTVAVTCDVTSPGPQTWLSLTANGVESLSALSEFEGATGRSVSVTSKSTLPFDKLRIGLHTMEGSARCDKVRLLFYQDAVGRMHEPLQDDFRKFTIGVIGHSTIHGYQATADHHIPHLLQLKLDSYFPGHFRVVNLGMASGTLMTQLLQFRFNCEFRHFQIPGVDESHFSYFPEQVRTCIRKPESSLTTWDKYGLDFVIISPMWNDIHSLARAVRTRVDGRPLHSILGDVLVTIQNEEGIAELSKLSEVAAGIQLSHELDMQYASEVFRDWTNQLITMFEARGVPSALLMLPQACGNRPEICTQYRKQQDVYEMQIDEEKAHRESLSAIAAARKLDWIDASAPFNKKLSLSSLTPKKAEELRYFFDYSTEDTIHMTERGNHFVVDVLFAAMRTRFEKIFGEQAE